MSDEQFAAHGGNELRDWEWVRFRLPYSKGHARLGQLFSRSFDLPLNKVSGGGFGAIVNTFSPATNPYGAFLSVPLTGRIFQLNARVVF